VLGAEGAGSSADRHLVGAEWVQPSWTYRRLLCLIGIMEGLPVTRTATFGKRQMESPTVA